MPKEWSYIFSYLSYIFSYSNFGSRIVNMNISMIIVFSYQKRARAVSLTKCIGNTFLVFLDIENFIYFDGNSFLDNGTTLV